MQIYTLIVSSNEVAGTVEHRLIDIPQGWLAGAWWEGSVLFCKWEYDAANRLLFVDWANQFCIETLDDDDCPPEKLSTRLPKIALALAKQLARGSSEPPNEGSSEKETRTPLFTGNTLRDRLTV